MNQLAHILITYLALTVIVPDASAYVIPMVLLSLLMDLDHLPGYVRQWRMPRRERAKITVEEDVEMLRSIIQEPIGVFTILAVLGVLWAFGVQHPLLLVAAVTVGLHWVVDFLTVPTRPLAPWSARTVTLFFRTSKQRMATQVALTLASVLLVIRSVL